MSYNNGVVSVDNNFARFGSKSYAINKINTVDVKEVRPHGWGPVIGFGLVGALLLFAAVGAAEQGGATGFVVIGLVCFGIAFWAWTRTKIRDYHLFLMTSSSSAQAYTTRNADEIMELREAIEAAMSREQSMRHSHEFSMRRDDEAEPLTMKRAEPSSPRQRLLRQSD